VKAHGTAVGLPSDADMGNSEVGHNALGSGQVVDQVSQMLNTSLSWCLKGTGQTCGHIAAEVVNLDRWYHHLGDKKTGCRI
jgi:bisphosphoglycerate-independent phosphoglycerate mutase (AlkP superfamily)